MRERQVQCLLMGGLSCVLYGAAEFSRGTDLVTKAMLSDQEISDPMPRRIRGHQTSRSTSASPSRYKCWKSSMFSVETLSALAFRAATQCM